MALTMTQTLDQWDARCNWHAYTQMQEYLSMRQLHIERGKGCWLYDSDGKRYLDATASLWTNVHGHQDPDLDRAVTDQLHKVAHSTWLGLSHPAGCRLSEHLVARAPARLERVFFSDNGATAVEVALKLSFQYWQLAGKPEKTLGIKMEGAYHGDTFGAMSVGDEQGFHSRFHPWLFPTLTFPAPLCREWGGEVYQADATESLRQLERMLQKQAERIAFLILEPSVQGAAGMRLQPPGFLKQVAAFCQRYGIHLILDEVFVGFGRLGSLFICGAEGVQPDFLCLSKGLTAGYLPMGATLMTEPIYEAFLGPFEQYRTFLHGHTFTANPLAAAVALKSSQKLEQRIDVGHLAETIAVFSKTLTACLSGQPHISEIRQRGLTAAIDLCPEGANTTAFPGAKRMGWKVCLAARQQGILLRPLGDTLLLVPPLVIQPDEIDFLLKGLVKALQAVFENEQA